MEEQRLQQEDTNIVQESGKEKKISRRRRGQRAGKGLSVLHILQHLCMTASVVLLVMAITNSSVFIDTIEGLKRYDLNREQDGTAFEESHMFNSLLGNAATDVIRLCTLQGQMETEGKFDPGKEVDITAYATRFEGLPTEYLTARYYLGDLIKWDNAFEFTTVDMTKEELEDFLSDSTVITRVGMGSYEGGMVGYLNSDLSKVTKTVSVSGNLLSNQDEGEGLFTMQVLTNKYRTVEGKNLEDYVSSKEQYDVLCSNLVKTSDALRINYNQYLELKKHFDPESSNVVYCILKTIGNDQQIFTNIKGNIKTASEAKNKIKDLCGGYVYYDAFNMQFETNTRIEESILRYILNGFEYAYPEDTTVMIGVRKTYSAEDEFYQGNAAFQKYVPFAWQYVAGALLFAMLYVLLLVVLSVREGKAFRKENGEKTVRLYWQDHIFTEIMVLAAAGAGAGLYLGITELINRSWQSVAEDGLVILAGVLALLVSLVISFFYYSFVRRIKAGSLWRDSLCRRLRDILRKWILYAYEHSSLILRVWVPFLVLILLNIGVTVLIGGISIPTMLILLLLIDTAAGYLLYRSAMSRKKILEGIMLIREGNLENKVKEEGMYGENLALARAVNSIGDSVRAAVETSMKDERLKADLITNVSHDIKTPLTSIINYVDLIRRENVQDPKIREYIRVLDQKSQRLKQLTDDLVEASKISSGNIVLQWEKINLVELLNQTIGEFSEKFEERSLYPVFNAPKGSACIEADSRRIWRVIENLFNNIVKYALEGTRVYIDLTFPEDKETGRQVLLSIKNISAKPLKVDPAELTERFIRGDESRTTEGSGLGLSIAKNLTEAQRGKFEIVMDGDLFKVNLYFPLLEKRD